MKILKKINVDAIILLILFIFYVVLYIVEGLQIPPDAEGYIKMVSYREPVYPLFLALFRMIFGDNYLWFVGLVQNIILAITATYFIKKFCQGFFLPLYMKAYMCIVFIGITIFCKMVVHVEYWFTNGIQTEGLAISLWLCYLTFILLFIKNFKQKYFLWTAITAIVLFNLRKQLITGFLIIVLTGLILIIMKKLNRSTIIKCISGTICAGGIALLIGPLYHLCLNGEFQQYNDTSSAFLTPVFYAADREMGQYIEDEEIQSLFYELYELADELQYNHKYSQDGWKYGNSQSVDYYQEVFNPLAFSVLRKNIQEYIVKKGIENSFEKDLEFDRLEGKMALSLMPYSIRNLFSLYGNCVLSGLIYSTVKPQMLLTPISLILYLLYVILLTLCFKRKKQCAFLGLIILITIVVNAMLTSFFIYPLTRYMIYNMYGFYVMMGIMLHNLYIMDKQKITITEKLE